MSRRGGLPGREHLSHAKPRRAATAAGSPEEGWMDRHQDIQPIPTLTGFDGENEGNCLSFLPDFTREESKTPFRRRNSVLK